MDKWDTDSVKQTARDTRRQAVAIRASAQEARERASTTLTAMRVLREHLGAKRLQAGDGTPASAR